MTSLALSLRSRTLLSNCLPNMFIQKFHKNLISPCLKRNYLLFLSPLDGLGISILFSSIAFHSYLYQAIAPIYLCLPFPTYYELFKECIHSFKYLLCSMHSTRYSSQIIKKNVINLGIQSLVKAGRYLISNLIPNTILRSHRILCSTNACYMNIANKII